MLNSILENLKLKSPALVRLRTSLGLDRAVAFTVLARGWSSVAGAVTLLLIARFLSPDEQGYYYAFGSLVALQIVFELGFSFVIQQMASHERAYLEVSREGLVSGDERAHARLASVLQKSIKWYTIAAMLLFVALLGVGTRFFSTYAHPSRPILWHFPWIMVSFAASLTFQVDPVFAFLEGCGYVSEVAKTRFLQALTGTLLAWVSLTTHHGLLAPAMSILGQALAGGICLYARRHLLLRLWKHPAGGHRIEWFTEVWPFQWRIAVSWISGYFIFQFFNPVLFAFRGPVAAGQMGMSLSIVSTLQAVAISWVNTKSAPFGTLIARKEYSKLDNLFSRAVKQSLAVYVIPACLLWAGVLYVNHAGISLAHRLLSPLPFALLLTATSINVAVFAEALYIRVHKQEKFLVNSVLTALFTASSTYFLGKQYGASGMVAGYLSVVICIGLGLGTYTFVKFRRVWHAE